MSSQPTSLEYFSASFRIQPHSVLPKVFRLPTISDAPDLGNVGSGIRPMNAHGPKSLPDIVNASIPENPIFPEHPIPEGKELGVKEDIRHRQNKKAAAVDVHKEQETPTGLTIDPLLVRKKKARRMRDSSLTIRWFSSKAAFAIVCPPPLHSPHQLEVDDLFVHTHGANQHQIWFCAVLQPRVEWKRILEGAPYYLLNDAGQGRVLVITEGGQPSWVSPETVERLYKHVKKTDKA